MNILKERRLKMHTEQLIKTLNILNRHDRDFKKLCEDIIQASADWTGMDEERNPLLRRIRTLAGYYLTEEDYFIINPEEHQNV